MLDDTAIVGGASGRTREEWQSVKQENNCGRTSVIKSKGYKGGSSGLKCIYVNARSVLNKMEELCTEVQEIDPEITILV